MATPHTFDPLELPIRASLAEQRELAWQRLTAPGTWWTGSQRRAIAAEARQAPDCQLCRDRREALSPYTVKGEHQTCSDLPQIVVDVIHRARTDAGRITQQWVEGCINDGISEEQYVEVIGIVAVMTALDRFDHALGLPKRELPQAQAGEPGRHRPDGARQSLAWVATTPPQAIEDGDPNPYPLHGNKHIHQALSLVPQEVFNFFDLDVELYLKDHEIRDFATEYRALSHAQIELMAGRVSAINGCYY